ncbi:MAG: hypothetical protein AABX33_07905 [Nanoarchaeota archaeon]
MISSKKGMEQGSNWYIIEIGLIIVFILVMIFFFPAVADASQSALNYIIDKLF